ncbi:MAG: hypothetical protein JWM45_3039 [Pseudonocardiales bacterium]|nr:hypothetical protein [Pseudonocardiales bacterium]
MNRGPIAETLIKVVRTNESPEPACWHRPYPGCAAAGTRWCRFGAGTNCLSR